MIDTTLERLEDELNERRLEATDLGHYPSYIEEMAIRADATMIVVNQSYKASIILTQLISMATNELKILTGCLANNIYGQKIVIEAIAKLCRMRSHVKVYILHEFPISENSLFKKVLDVDGGNNIAVRHLNVGNTTPARFAVVDRLHFQYEPDGAEGIVFFGEPNHASRIANVFDALWDMSGSN